MAAMLLPSVSFSNSAPSIFSQETPTQNAELPSWLGRLLEPVSRLRLLATGQGTRSPRTQQLLAISLIIGLQLAVIVVWNLVSSAHLDLVNIYPSQRSIQVSNVFLYYFLSSNVFHFL
jgi:hypothetical protein